MNFSLALCGFLIAILPLVIILCRSRVNEQGSAGTHAPATYPVIGCLPSFYANRSRLLVWYTQLLSKSPSLTVVVHRLGAPRTIITANPANVRHILADNFHNFPKGKPFSDILGDLLGSGIFNVDGHLWVHQRKLASHHFSVSSLRNHVLTALQSEVHRWLIPTLDSAAVTGGLLDLQEVLKRFTFNVICRITLGANVEDLDQHSNIPTLASAFDVAAGISAARGAAPVFAVWKLKRMLDVGSEKKLREAVRIVHQSVIDIIRKKQLEEDSAGKSDLLSQLLAAGHEELPVRDMVISLIMAGRDTTSSAMTWLFWLLSHHTDVENSLLDELRKWNADDVDSGDLMQKLKKMKYTKACLSESMRLYPPVAWDSKHAADCDVLPDGTTVRTGDRVTYFPYGMGRMEAVWGKDCHEFRPHRWFNGLDGEFKRVSPYVFPVFQAGPRVCLGKEMAFIQMKYVVASVLSRFEIRPVRPDLPTFVPLLTAQMAGGLQVLVRRRHHTSN